MSGFLVIVLLLCLLKDGSYKATAWDDKDFFSYCPPSWCSEHGPEIRFPFRLESSNTSSLCGAPGLNLACSGQDTILAHPAALASYMVTAIDYRGGALTLVPRVDSSAASCRQKLMSAALPHSIFDYRNHPLQLCSFLYGAVVIVSCLTEVAPSNSTADRIFGPISCLSNTTNFSYLVAGYAPLYLLPLDCKVVPDSFFPMSVDDSTFKETAEAILNFSKAFKYYYICADYGSDSIHFSTVYDCRECERLGGRCGFSPQRNQIFCVNHGMTLY